MSQPMTTKRVGYTQRQRPAPHQSTLKIQALQVKRQKHLLLMICSPWIFFRPQKRVENYYRRPTTSTSRRRCLQPLQTRHRKAATTRVAAPAPPPTQIQTADSRRRRPHRESLRCKSTRIHIQKCRGTFKPMAIQAMQAAVLALLATTICTATTCNKTPMRDLRNLRKKSSMR